MTTFQDSLDPTTTRLAAAGPGPEPLSRLLTHVRACTAGGAPPEDCLDGLADVLPTAAEVLDALPSGLRTGSPASVPLHLSEDLSVLAMVTAPGQSTSIHDHVSWCVSALLTGSEREERFVVEDGVLRLTGVRPDDAGALGCLDCDVIHRVTNTGPGVAVSLHVYGADLRGRSSVRTTYADHVARLVEVPGASLHVEQRGSGPAVLLVPGGAEDADAMGPLAEALVATGRTVLTWDPRGNSRSLLHSSATDVDVEEHADDAAAVLRSVTPGPDVARPALVVGTSGGAQVALALATRHPDLVHTVVAHEPPCAHVLDDPSEALRSDQTVLDAYAAGGVGAALAVFAADNDLPPMPPELMARMAANLDHFFAHGLAPITAYVPDLTALRSGSPRIVVAVGEDSAGQPIDAIARTLATRLDSELIVLPGDHMGLLTHAQACARVLDHL